MDSIKNKIDFAVVVSVKNANPNGDPLNGNRPRTNYDGLGELTDVCIKRKLRNRLQEQGQPIFVQSDENRTDSYRSLRSRADGELKNVDLADDDSLRREACKQWFDVRAFGQVFAYKGSGKKKPGKKSESEDDEKGGNEKGVSVGIRGPVSIHPAFSILPVSITSTQITKSVNGEKDGPTKAPDTMGMKHRVDHGLYVFQGSINPQLATKTGFSEDDADALKQALINLFQNDASSARPEGSMEVHKLYWWKHNSNNGQCSSAKVHRSLKVELKTGVEEPKCIEDYDISIEDIPGLIPEVHDGF